MQSGPYLGEDDIVRFEDVYGRQNVTFRIGHPFPPASLPPMTETLACFKAYDIRGQIPSQLNEDIAYRIGRAYAAWVKPGQVVVGRDVRLSSACLCDALVRGLRDSGAEVWDIGLCGTEEVYFATFSPGAGRRASLVTASHNPRGL